MGINIDRLTYDKTRILPPGQGYWQRRHPVTGVMRPQPNRIVIHTTNGVKGSSFDAEAKFLQQSTTVSAHYLVGKSGQVVRFLYPGDYIAWAVGSAVAGWGNYETINIECHYTPNDGGEGAWTAAMLDSLTLLVLEICTIALYPIGDLRISMDTHRHIALPPGRKIDPSGIDDTMFNVWREMVQCRREVAAFRR